MMLISPTKLKLSGSGSYVEGTHFYFRWASPRLSEGEIPGSVIMPTLWIFHRRDDDFPSLCVGKNCRSIWPCYNHCKFH